MGHAAIAMEDYVSSDERPVEKCLEDVRCCDVYIGIFAWRYGFIPPGFDKSITHLEYEAAGAVGIPRLIFLSDPKALWPAYLISKGTEREEIENLRNHLRKTHTLSFSPMLIN